MTQGHLEPLQIPEYDMAADPFTKYLVFLVLLRHMHHVLNFKGDVPPPNKQASVDHSIKRGCDMAVSTRTTQSCEKT